MKKILLVLGLLITHDAMAQSCIAVPDCAAMGYTETSCEGDFLRCPFDTTKMACLSSQSGGANCRIGDIYYTDKTCSSTYNSSKTVAGIVVEDGKLIMSKPVKMTWASDANTDVVGLTNFTSGEVVMTDMNGRSNTIKIVAQYTSDTTSNNAAKYCNEYTGGISGTAGRWYLPAAGEVYAYIFGYYNILKNTVSTLGWSNFTSTYFWSSSEADSDGVWSVGSYNGFLNYSGKGTSYSVSCLLAL